MKFVKINRLPEFEISELGVIRNIKTKRIKSQYIGSTGYYMASFSYKNKSKPKRVHRLIAEVFIPNPLGKPEVNHKDGNKLNNSIDNLEWVTHEENMNHAFKAGLANNTGVKNGMCKLNESKVKKIKQMLAEGVSQYKIAKEIGGISRSTVMNIKNRNQWRHVSV